MPNHSDAEHECDLFLLSSHKGYFANNSLRNFASLGIRNNDGWGIGPYANGEGFVVKSEHSAIEQIDISREFKVAINSFHSPAIRCKIIRLIKL